MQLPSSHQVTWERHCSLIELSVTYYPCQQSIRTIFVFQDFPILFLMKYYFWGYCQSTCQIQIFLAPSPHCWKNKKIHFFFPAYNSVSLGLRSHFPLCLLPSPHGFLFTVSLTLHSVEEVWFQHGSVWFQRPSTECFSVPYKLTTEDVLKYRYCSHTSVPIILANNKAYWEHIKASILE